MELRELLRQLSEMHAPTGEEDEVADFMAKEFSKNGFEVKKDMLGNVIAKKGSGKRKVLLAAHMDEVGLAVMGITREGFLKFTKVGGIYDGILSNMRVVIHAKKKIRGIIGAKPPHLMKDEELKKLPEYDQMYIDIGAKDKAAAEALGIKPGTRATFDATFADMDGGRGAGKSLDNRIGCAILVKLAEEIKKTDCTVYLVGTVREETGLYGAGTAAFGIDPDLAIAVDTTPAAGTPDVSEDSTPVKFEHGPSLGVLDAAGRGLIMPKKLVDWIGLVAKKRRIPLQYEVSERGATDASRMQYVKTGILAASIGVPTRYLHSLNEMASFKDLESAKNLLKAIIEEFPEYE
ncbi:MAG: M42 family metallopeptidase [Candidatus Micrarchaeota archaeon]|nr:M42 family metallopeptidase [Candidatus Micrarchaeota archaeon]